MLLIRFKWVKDLNPQDWVQIGSGTGHPVVEGKLAEWDTTGLNGLYVIRLQVVDANNVIKTGLQQVTVDNTPPRSHWNIPAANRILPASYPLLNCSSRPDLTGISDLKQVDVLDRWASSGAT